MAERKTIFLGNLAFGSTEDDVKSLCATLGIGVKEILIPRDRTTRKSKGFAFVTVTDDVDIEDAVTDLHNYSLAGRPLRADVARPKPT